MGMMGGWVGSECVGCVLGVTGLKVCVLEVCAGASCF